MANYSLDTFIKTPEQGDKKLFIYDNSNNLAYVLEPLDVNFFYKNNKLVIHHLRTRIERQPCRDHEYTELDFESVAISQQAEQKANNFKNIVLGYTDYYTTTEVDDLLEQKVDISVLTNYYTSSQTNVLLENYYTSGETDNLLENYYTSSQTNDLLENYYTSGETDDLFTNSIWTFDFMTDLTIDIYAPFNIKINSVTAIVNNPTTIITVNSNPYSLGDTITTGSLINVTVDINSVINLIVKT